MAGLDVHLVTPTREVWSGDADMVIARGTEGEVGVLQGHAPMLIRLAIGPLRIQRGGSWEGYVVDGGFLHVTSDQDTTRLDVLADHAVHSADIDAEEARRQREAAQERLRERRDDAEAQAALAKATARLTLLSMLGLQ